MRSMRRFVRLCLAFKNVGEQLMLEDQGNPNTNQVDRKAVKKFNSVQICMNQPAQAPFRRQHSMLNKL